MALKKVLDNLDGLSDDVKKEYKEKDGKFHLDLDGDDSEQELTHLRTKKQIAEEHRTRAETKVRELQEKLDEIHRGAVPKGDVEALENSWKDKLATTESKLKEREQKLQKQLQRATIGARAEALAAELSVAPELMAPEIAKRLTVEESEDGEIRIRVKGPDGKPSAMSIDDLKNEIKADKRYAPVLIGSKASGGGANGNNGSNGNGGGDPSGKKPHEMSEAERVAFYKKDPEGYRRAFGL